MELSEDGARATALASGETRTFLEDGDEAIFRAHCHKPGLCFDRVWRVPRPHRLTPHRQRRGSR